MYKNLAWCFFLTFFHKAKNPNLKIFGTSHGRYFIKIAWKNCWHHLSKLIFFCALGTVYNYQCFKKKNNVLLCGWVGQSEKSMFLVFFSLNPDIPWYVSCLENIHFMLKNIHFICSHDTKFKYKNVLLNIPMMHCSTM